MKRLTTTQLRRKPREGERIVMVTCYDATFARLVDEAGVDAILIGDSLGMVIQGHENTLPVTLDEVIYHCRAVARGSVRPHLVGDLPFGSYQESSEQLMTSATRLLKEGGVQSVKLEGGEEYAEGIFKLVRAGIQLTAADTKRTLKLSERALVGARSRSASITESLAVADVIARICS